MAEIKGAVPQPWILKNSSVAAGTLEKQKIHSEILKNEHDLSVYLPAGYKANATPYNLVVIFDESAYLTKVPTPVILDNLIAASKIPPTVAVLIANPSQESRNEELTPNPKFADFLAKELVPGYALITTSQTILEKPLSLGRAWEDSQRFTPATSTLKFSLTLYVNRGRFGGLPTIQGPFRTE
jgi:hypothetical protein